MNRKTQSGERRPIGNYGGKSSSKAATKAVRVLKCGRPVPAGADQSETRAGSSWKEKLDEFVIQNALNHSESRNRLIEAALHLTRQNAGHFTAQDLVKTLAEAHPQIGAATVYRNLPLLIEAGIFKETLTDDSGLKIYEIGGDDHHDHVVCSDCQEIFEFHDESIEKAQDRILKSLGFKPIKHRHVIFASCEYLSKKER